MDWRFAEGNGRSAMAAVCIGDNDFDQDLRVIKIGDEYQILDREGLVLLETDADDFPF
jgi:hypothetical protein